MKNSSITLSRLKELLIYNLDSGLFRVKQGGKGRRKPGTIAGWISSQGYRKIQLDGITYSAHRLVWFYVHGEWPKDQLDHEHGQRADNRILELREATNGQNKANARLHRNSTSGFKGVSLQKDCQKWRARIQKNGKKASLGLFDTAIEAHQAYCDAAAKQYGKFANTG